MTQTRRLVVGISGATGIAYGIRVLELARKAGAETHLVITPAGQQTRAHETDLSARDLAAMADVCHRPADIGASIASGSLPTQVAGEVYLDEAEQHSYQAGKVVYNCLLADRFDEKERPVKGDLEHGWPAEVVQRVLGNWHTYGYRDKISQLPQLDGHR